MPERDGYIAGVPCWIDTSQPDPKAAADFYSSLFGWDVEDVMPPDAPGEYQGVFATGEATALMFAPALMTTLVAGWGQPGWLVLAGVFLLPAATVIPATRWALRGTDPLTPAAS